MTHLRTVPVVLALLLGGLLAPPAASAARPTKVRPTVTMAADRDAVAAGETVVLAGRVTRRSRGAKVVLQVRDGGRWSTRGATRVGAGRVFRLRWSVPAGESVVRARVLATRRLRSATSPVVRLTGVAPQGPGEGPTPGPGPEDGLAAARALILAETNAHRAAAGLPALRPMTELDVKAQAWSASMATRGVLQHDDRFVDGYPAGWSNAGENIAMGYALEAVTDAWFASPGHRANILGDFTHLGIGMQRDGRGTAWYTQNFARYAD